MPVPLRCLISPSTDSRLHPRRSISVVTGDGTGDRDVQKSSLIETVVRIAFSIALLALANGCAEKALPDFSASGTKSLAEARSGFATRLGGTQPPGEAIPEPPPNLFRHVKYRSPAGELSAYLTPDPDDDAKHPAI